jgi:hopanoid biosynthesis associated protein HpnK
VLGRNDIPGIVDGEGRFDDNLVRAGFRYFFIPRARRQLAAEIRAQFDAFAETGLALDHANAHNHMHLHPTVLGLIISIGREFGLGAVRLPFEPGVGFAGLLLRPWIALMKRRLRRAGLRHNDYLFGIAATGRMDRHRMIDTLSVLPDGTSEIMTHPATGGWDGVEPAAAAYRFADEFAALIDPAVRAAAETTGAERISFAALG